MRSVRVLVVLAALLAARAGLAQARRALLVGIRRYPELAERGPRGGWPAVEGADNDVLAVREILVARYGFRREDVTVLMDEAATRGAILGELRRVLIAPSREGDVGVFFFAGHGSWQRNSLSREPDRRDRTIVPVDGEDIRSKELARLLAEAASRGAVVTALFDSCHSGSIARGVSVPRGVRALPPRPGPDALDPNPAPTPVQSGVLVMSAAQDDQGAAELKDEDGVLHGAFTAALIRVLRVASVDADAESVFLRTRALLQASGATQDPVLDAPPHRWREPLFGPSPSRQGGGRLTVAAGAVDGDRVELLAGLAVGLAPGAILVREGNGPRVRLRVEEVRDLLHSLGRPATATDAAAPIAPGDLFSVEEWAAQSRSPIRVFLGPALPAAEVREAARRLAPLRRDRRIEWVSDPSALAPTHVLFRAASGWRLRGPDGREEEAGERPSAQSISRLMAKSTGEAGRERPCDARPCLFVRLPVPAELVERLLGPSSVGRTIVPTEEADALYLLAGRLAAGGAPQFAWILGSGPPRGADGPASPLPRRSAWRSGPLSDPSGAATALEDAMVRISRIRTWLTLEAPAPGEENFPYHLALGNADAVPVPMGADLHRGDVLEPILVADRSALAQGSAVRNVYLLVVDSEGRVRVLFPADLVSLDNRFPAVEPGQPLPSRIPLESGRFRVVEPLGVDTYVLLATERPIPDLAQVEQAPVLRGPPGDRDFLLDLLAGSPTRGSTAPALGAWSIDRVVERSVR